MEPVVPSRPEDLTSIHESFSLRLNKKQQQHHQLTIEIPVAMDVAMWRGRPLLNRLCYQAGRPQSVYRSPRAVFNRSRPLHTTTATGQPDREVFGKSSRHGKASPSWNSGVKATSMRQPTKLERKRSHVAQRAGPLSPEAKDLERRLEIGEIEPIAALQQYIADGEANSEIVRVCLVSTTNKLFKLPRKKRLTEARKADPGLAKLALLHIWEDPRLWIPIVFADFQAQEALCWLAIAEGAEKFIFDWIRSDVETELKAQNIPLPEEVMLKKEVWRGSMLRNLVHAYLMQDEANSADSALNCLFDVIDLKTELRARHESMPNLSQRGIMWTSLRPARVVISGAITGGFCFKTDPKLYDRYMKFCQHANDRDRKFRPQIAALRAADLELHHPTSPSAQATMHLLRGMCARGGISQPYLNVGDVSSMARRMMEQAYMLTTKQGKLDDAVWIEEKYHQAFGEPVRAHKGYAARWYNVPPRTAHHSDFKSFRPQS